MSDYDYPTHVAPRGKQSLYQKDVQSGADELSTFDCSVVDSEFVSEYCQTNLQVNQEQNRLSPVSSNESLTPSYADSIEKNRLSLLSRDSDLQKNNSFSSDKVPVLDEDLMKLAVKEKLYDYETEPLMYTNMNTSEAEQNMINNMLNDGDSGISNGPQLMANHNPYSMPCCQPLQRMGEDCSQQLLMQRGMTHNMPSIPGYPIYHDYSHSNNYSSVDVGLANCGRIPAERMQQQQQPHRADDQLNSTSVRHGGKRMEKHPSFSECWSLRGFFFFFFFLILKKSFFYLVDWKFYKKKEKSCPWRGWGLFFSLFFFFFFFFFLFPSFTKTKKNYKKKKKERLLLIYCILSWEFDYPMYSHRQKEKKN